MHGGHHGSQGAAPVSTRQDELPYAGALHSGYVHLVNRLSVRVSPEAFLMALHTGTAEDLKI